MKTFKHKVADVLATLTEKTVWMSDMQGRIYKQFSLKHFNPEHFEDSTIEYPCDFEAARLKYVQQQDAKRKEREAQKYIEWQTWQKNSDEHKNMLRLLWKTRKAVQTNGKACLYVVRAEDGLEISGVSTRDPEWKNVDGYPKLFLTYEEAEQSFEEARKQADPDFGHEVRVEVNKLSYDEDILDVTSADDFEERYMRMYCDEDSETEDCVYYRDYRSIEGGVVLYWQWKTHAGYCRSFIEVEWGGYGKTEQNLITHNEESVFRTCATLLLTADDLKGMTDTEKLDRIMEALSDEDHYSGYWKWDYFRDYPTRRKVASMLGLNDVDEDEE